MLRKRLRVALVGIAACIMLAPAQALAGNFEVVGPTIVYHGEPGVDQIAGFDTGTSIRFTRFGGVAVGPGPGCVLVGDNSVDCNKAGVSSVLLNLEGGDDVASVGATVTIPVVFNGGDGNDGLFGGGGVDIFDGGPGNDNVVARDGRAEQVNCGDGLDTAITDDADARVSCEEVEGDADGDGVRRPADCNDTNPAIHPGAIDVPDDGIDQDCSGTDATNLDRDRDGSPRPQDCDDSNPAVHPGAREIAGNGIDENCDTRIVPFPPIGGVVANAWIGFGSLTRNVTLTAKKFPKRTKIRMRCSGRGCPFRSVTRRVKSRRAVKLHRFLGRHALRPGARVELRFTLRGHIGRVLRFRMRSPGGLPDVDFLCLPPGGKIRDC